MALETYNKNSTHFSYNIISTTQLDNKIPSTFKFINTENSKNYHHQNLNQKYALAYPKNRSYFQIYSLDTEPQKQDKKSNNYGEPKAKSARFNSKNKAASHSDNKSGKFIASKPVIVKEQIIAISDDASQILTFPGNVQRLFEFKLEKLKNSACFRVYNLPETKSCLEIPLPTCLQEILDSAGPGIENFDIFDEINKIEISNKFSNFNDRLLVICHSKSQNFEIFNHQTWSNLSIPYNPSLDKLFYNNFLNRYTYGQIYFLNINSSLIAKLVDLENLKTYKIFHNHEISLENLKVKIGMTDVNNNFITPYYSNLVSFDNLIILCYNVLTDVDSQGSKKLYPTKSQIIQIINISTSQSNVIQIDTSSNIVFSSYDIDRDKIILTNSIGSLIMINLFSFSVEKIFIQQTRFTDQFIVIHPIIPIKVNIEKQNALSVKGNFKRGCQWILSVTRPNPP